MKTREKKIGPPANRPDPDKVNDGNLLYQLASAVGAGERDRAFDLAVALVADADAEFLPLRKVARRLTVSERSVWRLVARGDLAEPVHIGGSARWRRDDVRAYLDRIAARRGNGRS